MGLSIQQHHSEVTQLMKPQWCNTAVIQEWFDPGIFQHEELRNSQND